jgi:glycosyltransferase involved in cell wall biosynthesis
MSDGAIRVLFLTESREIWGAEQSLLLLLDTAKDNGFTPVVATSMESPLKQVLTARGYEVIAHRFARHPALERNGSLARARPIDLVREVFAIANGAIRLRAVVSRFDLVVSFSLWQAFEVGLAARLTGTRSVLDLHETFHGRLGKRLVGIIARLFDTTISPSASLVSTYRLRSPWQVIPRPAELSVTGVGNRSTADLSITVGIFGQISPHKGVAEFVKAVESLDRNDLRLLVVGGRPPELRDEYEADVRTMVGSMGAGSRVIDRQESVDALMQRCDFVVNVSSHEAFGRTVLEAVSNGATPLVLSGAGPEEIVANIGVGRAFNSIAELADFLRTATSATIPAGTIAEVAESFSPRAIGAKYFNVLRGLRPPRSTELNEGGAPRATY